MLRTPFARGDAHPMQHSTVGANAGGSLPKHPPIQRSKRCWAHGQLPKRSSSSSAAPSVATATHTFVLYSSTCKPGPRAGRSPHPRCSHQHDQSRRWR